MHCLWSELYRFLHLKALSFTYQQHQGERHTIAFFKFHSDWCIDNTYLVRRYTFLDRMMVLMVSVDDVIEAEA